ACGSPDMLAGVASCSLHVTGRPRPEQSGVSPSAAQTSVFGGGSQQIAALGHAAVGARPSPAQMSEPPRVAPAIVVLPVVVPVPGGPACAVHSARTTSAPRKGFVGAAPVS